MTNNRIVIAAATALSKHILKTFNHSNEATDAVLANFNLSPDERQEAEDLAAEWVDDETRDMPERIAHAITLQTEPLDQHGAWGAP